MIHDNYLESGMTMSRPPDCLKPGSSGMVLVMVVIMATLAGVLAMGLQFASASRITQTRQELRFDRAFTVSEAGIERAKAYVRTYTKTNSVLFGGFTNYGEGKFYVSVRNSASGTNRVIIRSTGVVETAKRVLEVEVQVTPLVPPNTDGALGIYGTNTDLTITGNGKIDGHDWYVPLVFDCNGAGCNGTLSTNEAAPGVFYTSTTTVISADSDSTDGDPPITNGTPVYSETYWYDFLDLVIQSATVYTDASSFGTRAAPNIVMLPPGATTIAGNTEGAGIFIIPGDATLRITGTWHYEGLVILVGNGVIDAGDDVFQSGTARIFGSVIAVGGGLDINATGTADIKYSTEALANLANLQAKKPINMISWKEIKASSTSW
jgi:hypothetical protein